MVSGKEIVIDGENHLLGRLSAIIAKQLLLGKKIVVVRCEGICMSGKYLRMERKYKLYLRKRVNTNPRKGPFHFRSPAKMLIKSVRGMLPSRTERGKRVLKKLSTHVGVPPKYSHAKRMTVPSAHRVLCLQPGKPYNKLKRLAKNFGWKYHDVTERLEKKRKERGLDYIKSKKERLKLLEKTKIKYAKMLAPIESQMRELGYICQ